MSSNPFLFTEEVGSTQLPSGNSPFNPFLAGNDLGEAQNDNPFMSAFSDTQNIFDNTNTIATNPFAIEPDSSNSNVNFFSTSDASTEQSSINYENIFSQPQAHPHLEVDLFGPDPNINQNNFMQEDLMSSNEQQNSGVFASSYESEFIDDSSKGPPKRPPPPRPGPPKETKDLILSVTGAMEATSSHLLDRLQATRTPSPTPMRDLHSPSPTQFGDLLEVDEPSGITGPVSHTGQQEHQEVNFLGDDFDFQPAKIEPEITQKRPSIIEGTIAPITPAPLESEHVQPVVPIPKPAVPPSRPAPPVIPERPRVPPQPPRPPVPTRPKTPEIPPSVTPKEILSPPQQAMPKQTSEFDEVFGQVIPNDISAAPQPMTVPTAEPYEAEISNEPQFVKTIINGNSLESSAMFSSEAGMPLVTEETRPTLDMSMPPLTANIPPTTPPAPPPSANVLSEDKSDFFDMEFAKIQATASFQPQTNIFNAPQVDSSPFAEPTPQNASINNNAFTDLGFPPESQSYNIFDAFNSSSQLPQEAKQDDFDAFAAKFESAGFGETEGKKVDPFDPFSTGGAQGTATTGGIYKSICPFPLPMQFIST